MAADSAAGDPDLCVQPEVEFLADEAVVGTEPRKVEDSKRVTTNYMTKYERARVLGTRALQLR